MSKKQYPKVDIESFELIQNNYDDGINVYNVLKLIEHSKKYEAFDLPLAGIDLSRYPWGKLSIKQYCYHAKRALNSDLRYPILLDPDGYICDGWHRLAKALIKGNTTIKAIRMESMPEPDRPSDIEEE